MIRDKKTSTFFTLANFVFVLFGMRKTISDFSLNIPQVMICAGVSVSYIIGTVITWRALALSGNTLIKHANKKKRGFNC